MLYKYGKSMLIVQGVFILVKVAIKSIFLLSRLILHNTQLTFLKKIFDLHKMQFFEYFFKDVQICRHFGPPFAAVFLGLK